MSKMYKFAKRCPMHRTSFESIKSCLISIVRNDGAVQVIKTHPAFLQLEKNEKLDTKIQFLAEDICGLHGVKSTSYAIS
jgi:hypothetical protein